MVRITKFSNRPAPKPEIPEAARTPEAVALCAWLDVLLGYEAWKRETAELIDTEDRIVNGTEWIRTHPSTHPRYHEARSLLMDLHEQSRILDQQRKARIHTAWYWCQVAADAAKDAAPNWCDDLTQCPEDQSSAEAMWRGLWGFEAPEYHDPIGIIEVGKQHAEVWNVPEMKELVRSTA